MANLADQTMLGNNSGGAGAPLALTSTQIRALLGVEAGATADQTNAEIVAAVEAGTDSNTFTDADHSKLNGIEASATADQSDAEIRAAVEAATDSNVFTDADHSKLNGIEASATADQTAIQIMALLNSDLGGNVQIGTQSDDLLTIGGSLTVTSDLVVEGDLVTLNVAKLDVEDATIRSALGAASLADGQGFEIGSATGVAALASFVVGGTAQDSFVSSLKVKAASGFVGNLSGDVTGDLTGDVTGNVTGTLDGAIGGTTPAAAELTTLSLGESVKLTGDADLSTHSSKSIFFLNGNTLNINVDPTTTAKGQILFISAGSSASEVEVGGVSKAILPAGASLMMLGDSSQGDWVIF